MSSEKSGSPATVWDLSGLSPRKGSRRRRKRVGFGESSGHGKTCCKGQKGQKSRSGYEKKRGFEGGQMPLHRRLPKVGFTSRKRVRGENDFKVVSLARLAEAGVEGEVTIARLRELGLSRSATDRIKILGPGELKKKIVIEAHAVSGSARAAIEKAGGEVRIV